MNSIGRNQIKSRGKSEKVKMVCNRVFDTFYVEVTFVKKGGNKEKTNRLIIKNPRRNSGVFVFPKLIWR